jgi:DNA-binding NarL/FixJ family response regulator
VDHWGAVGSLWDQAYDGQAGLAAARASHLAGLADDPAEHAVFLGVRALFEILMCRFSDATQTAIEAAVVAESAGGSAGEDARFFTGSLRLLAAAMFEPGNLTPPSELPMPNLAELQAYAATVDRDRPERLLLVQPLIEASMSSGYFADVGKLVTAQRPFVASDSSLSILITTFMELVVARSLAFLGDLDGVTRQCATLLKNPDIVNHPQAGMLVNALLCYVAGQRSDRKEVERLGAAVLAEARRGVNYVSVGSCLLLSWSFTAIGQIQRAAALLVGASGGAPLPRIKPWDRAFGYELLVSAALRRGDLVGARAWAARAERPSQRPVFAAGHHRIALQTLTDVETVADELGAASARTLAAGEWRSLGRRARSAEGGFASLSDREREIAILVAEGHTNRSIGNTLFLSERTVQTHLSRILSVLGLPSRAAIPAAIGTGSAPVDVPALTGRQEQIAGLVARGYPNANIASELGISVKTVENHLAGIFTRWQVSSRTAVANTLIARSRAQAQSPMPAK